MTNLTRIAMLLGLIGLVLAMISLSTSFNILGELFDGSFPWIALAVVFFVAAKHKGCCGGSRGCRSEP